MAGDIIPWVALDEEARRVASSSASRDEEDVESPMLSASSSRCNSTHSKDTAFDESVLLGIPGFTLCRGEADEVLSSPASACHGLPDLVPSSSSLSESTDGSDVDIAEQSIGPDLPLVVIQSEPTGNIGSSWPHTDELIGLDMGDIEAELPLFGQHSPPVQEPVLYICQWHPISCDASTTCPLKWRTGTKAHFKDHKPPSSNICPFCNSIFEHENGDVSWDNRMFHVDGHAQRGEDGHKYYKPEFALWQFLHERGLLFPDGKNGEPGRYKQLLNQWSTPLLVGGEQVFADPADVSLPRTSQLEVAYQVTTAQSRGRRLQQQRFVTSARREAIAEPTDVTPNIARARRQYRRHREVYRGPA
ncbi:MAG: hypothetical protein M1814_005254 [Vezdaea aestivalis]|nr:MAG: hypothetical protein M1814_005254 [Vezdaea aestivalis]